MGTLLAFQAIFLGIIEGITEFIPVSSTAHLLLAGQMTGLTNGPFLEALSISIQSGAILAAVWYFWNTVWKQRTLIPKVIVAFLPTALVGLLLYPYIKTLFSSTLVIAFALILGGIGLILIKPNDENVDTASISYKQAFLIGLSQLFSFIPGVSRAGATLIGGSLLAIPRSIIVPFSFLLAIPTILGATAVEALHVEKLPINEWVAIGLGALVAFIVALFTIRFFIRILSTKPLSWFGWYRIVLGIVVLLFFI